jgi:magnesium chelatase family protein
MVPDSVEGPLPPLLSSVVGAVAPLLRRGWLMLAAVSSASVLGVTGQPVTVEVHVGPGLPTFQIVGLPDEACRESRDRVRAAVLSSGLDWPNKRITVNLAPSGLRKGGSGLDLAIAIGVLVADERLDPVRVRAHAVIGELGLDGSLRPLPGVAPMVASQPDLVPVVPAANWAEAVAVHDGAVRCASSLGEVVLALAGGRWPEPPETDQVERPRQVADLADVRGQPEARAGLEIAAAGGHHLLLVGPPGSGKTMLAQRLVGLLPAHDHATALEVTMVHSAAGVGSGAVGVVRYPTLRAPHHTSSMVSLIGGGSHSLRPGEVSLCHGGVLFLDELGEFAPTVLDALRQPLEEGVVRVARAHSSATLPARFLLVAATNPCPCGGGPPGSCECDEAARQRYLRRLSGPLLDRFDLRIGVHRTAIDDLLGIGGGESTAVVRERVDLARAKARERNGMLNAAIAPADLDRCAPLTADATNLLRTELERGRLTGRGLHRVRRVARTIADLSSSDQAQVQAEHVALALQLRVRLRVSARSDAA